MSTGQRNDPYRNYRFRIEIDGIQTAGFSDVTIADTSVDATDYREGTDPPYQRKLSGMVKYGNITLKKGLTDSTDLYDWQQQIVQKGASGNRKSLSLILMDEAGTDQAQWDIVEAWPVKYAPSDFSAKGSDVLIETLELVHEGITRVK
jgi:phage tail-like protein